MTWYQSNALYFLIVTTWYICHTEGVECDRRFGPAGTSHCIKIPRYADFQWSTCRTDTYIKTTSKGKHQCEDFTTTYCYYQCMLDVYDKNNGEILDHCLCLPGDPKPTGITQLAWCYSPSGTNCTWYRQCLNKVYPMCENDKDDYAIKYAEKFCELYSDRYEKFSQQGQQWVDAVRRCLQVKLVPLLDRTRDHKCEELKSRAFDSHTPCYLDPDSSSLSFCDLSLSDQWAVFWTIKSAFLQSFLPSLGGVLEVLRGCNQTKKDSRAPALKANIEEKVKKREDHGKDIIGDTVQETKQRINAWVENPLRDSPIQIDMFIKSDDWRSFINRKKRSVNDNEEIARSYFAGKIVNALALEEEWKGRGVAWFAYANNETVDEHNNTSIRLLLADRYKYEIPGAYNSTLSFTQPANLTGILAQLSEAVIKGTLTLRMDGDNIEIVKMNGCLDWNCEVHAFNVTYLKSHEPNSAESHRATYTCTISGLLLAYFVLLVITFM